jgi:protein-L-isoaspartate(D-aspartate) O-methyltransferase
MDLELAREQMISQQLRAWEVFDERVLGVMREVPRERFLPDAYRGLAFADAGIPIGHGEMMLPPKIQGRILQAVMPTPEDAVLEIGTGTGFLTACLARLGRDVHSIEIHEHLSAAAAERLRAITGLEPELTRADALAVDLDRRYDVIVVTGALPVYDDRFERALAPRGRLFVVVGPPPVREAWLVTADATGATRRDVLFETDIPELCHARQPERFAF